MMRIRVKVLCENCEAKADHEVDFEEAEAGCNVPHNWSLHHDGQRYRHYCPTCTLLRRGWEPKP